MTDTTRRQRTLRVTHSWTDQSASIAVEGLAQPVRMLHVTDAHVTLADERDAERLPGCAGAQKHFASMRKDSDGQGIPTDVTFAQTLAATPAQGLDLLALTGDLIHFPAQASIEFIAAEAAKTGVASLYTSGNHDWHFPDLQGRDALRRAWWPALTPLHGGEAEHAARIVGSIAFVAIDNSTYQVSEAQLAFLQQHLASGLPTVVLMHIPLSIATLRDRTIATWKAPILIADPDWDPVSRDRWGTDADAASTLAFARTLATAPNLVAVFCGHIHFAHSDAISPRAVQYVGAPGFGGGYRLVEFKPLVDAP